MGRILKTFLKQCSYCDEIFGCITSDGTTKKCTTCELDHSSTTCSTRSIFSEISHGLCTEECFLTSLRISNPQMAKRYEEFTYA